MRTGGKINRELRKALRQHLVHIHMSKGRSVHLCVYAPVAVVVSRAVEERHAVCSRLGNAERLVNAAVVLQEAGD